MARIDTNGIAELNENIKNPLEAIYDKLEAKGIFDDFKDEFDLVTLSSDGFAVALTFPVSSFFFSLPFLFRFFFLSFSVSLPCIACLYAVNNQVRIETRST